MPNDYKGLKITDNLASLEEYVLKEEIAILAPYLSDMILKVNETVDHGKDDKDKSRPVRQG